MPDIPISLRQLVHERAKGYCEYCRSPERFGLSTFNIEHIRPESQGGPTTAENLAFSCPGCNSFKSDKTESIDPLTGEMERIFNPRIDAWGDHFAWKDFFSLIVGTTAIGRSTVLALQLNRVGVVNLRRALFSLELHPPEAAKNQTQ
jgi:hypothetical protein